MLKFACLSIRSSPDFVSRRGDRGGSARARRRRRRGAAARPSSWCQAPSFRRSRKKRNIFFQNEDTRLLSAWSISRDRLHGPSDRGSAQKTTKLLSIPRIMDLSGLKTVCPGRRFMLKTFCSRASKEEEFEVLLLNLFAGIVSRTHLDVGSAVPAVPEVSEARTAAHLPCRFAYHGASPSARRKVCASAFPSGRLGGPAETPTSSRRRR